MTATMCFRLAAINGFLVVALGAFGAHGLKTILQANQRLDTWDTAVFYHALHTLVLLALAMQTTVSRGAVWCFVVGILVFSGSLYTLALANIRWLGAITPLGGLSFLLGWAWLAFTAGSHGAS